MWHVCVCVCTCKQARDTHTHTLVCLRASDRMCVDQSKHARSGQMDGHAHTHAPDTGLACRCSMVLRNCEGRWMDQWQAFSGSSVVRQERERERAVCVAVCLNKPAHTSTHTQKHSPLCCACSPRSRGG